MLEHNISPAAVLGYKRRSIATVGRLAALVGKHIPELGPERTEQLITVAALLITAVWPHPNPPAAHLDIYESYPEIACKRVEFV